MARIRAVKPEVRRSLTVGQWPPIVRLAWIYLWGYLDDEGRGIDDMRLIVAELFPLDRNVTEKKMDTWLQLMASTTSAEDDEPPVCRYKVSGRQYLHAPKWAVHQRINRPQPSRLPPCPFHDHSVNDSVNDSRSDSVTDSLPSRAPADQGSGKGTGIREQGEDQGTRARRASRLNRDWTPNRYDHQQLGFNDTDAQRELDAFRDYWCSKSGKDATKLDWQATWRNWLRRANQPRNGRASTTDSRVAEGLALADRLERRAIE